MRGEITQTTTFVVSLGPSNTGLSTVGYTLVKGDGTTFQSRRTTGVTEIGGGYYYVRVANSVFTIEFDGIIEWDIATVFKAAEDVFITDRVDAAISSRSTYAGGDTAGTTTLLARLTSTRAGLLDNLDAAISSLPTAASITTAVWAAATRTLTAASDSSGVTTLLSRLTSGRATNLDNLDAAVSTRSTYAGGDTSGVTTLLSRLTSGRATNLDNLDSAVSGVAAAVWAIATAGLTSAGTIGKLLRDNIDAAISTRLATSGYTAPDNTDVAAIKAKTDTLPADPASEASVESAITAAEGTLAAAIAALPSASTIATAVWAAGARTLTAISDSAGVTTLLSRLTSGRASNLDNLDSAVSTRLATSGYTAPPTAAAIADEVWDEPEADHTTAGTTGLALSNAGGSGADPWLTELPGSYTGDEAGALLPAIKAKTDLLTEGGAVTVAAISPNASQIAIISGDDYLARDGRALAWNSDGWPDITGAAVTLRLQQLGQDPLDPITGTAVSATEARVELDAATTAALNTSRYEYSVVAVLTNDDTVTLATGQLTVRAAT